MLTRLCIVAFLVTAGTACNRHNKRATTTVLERAAFDFPCAQSELSLAVLEARGARYMATHIAAYGCGKRAIYVFNSNTNTWFLDGDVSSASAAHAVQPKMKN
ncbi:MAG: hypothetical protein OEQ49_02190 [Myxococcales bacterium]|nr:hypothetical protein [Myxococcales bacterium]